MSFYDVNGSLLSCSAALTSSIRKQHMILTRKDTGNNILENLPSTPTHDEVLSVLKNIRQSSQDDFNELRNSWKHDDVLFNILSNRIEKSTSNNDNVETNHHIDILPFIVDFMLRNGFIESAQQLMKHLTNQLIEIEIFRELSILKNSLIHKQTITPSLEWAETNRLGLRKIGSTLEFNLRLQECKQLFQNQDYTIAIKYARKYLIGACTNPKGREKLKDVMSLIAYSGDKREGVDDENIVSSTWTDLANQIQNDFCKLHHIIPFPPLYSILQNGIQGILTPHCRDTIEKHHSHEKRLQKNCPICCELWVILPDSKRFPYAYATKSRVICPISHCIITNPVVLPNGKVCDRKSLNEMPSGKVKCKELCKEEFSIESLQSLHIL